MAEPIDILGEYLKDATAVGSDGINLVTWLGGEYISSPVAPPGWKNTHKAIIYHEESGDSHITDSTRSGMVVFKCYGGSSNYDSAIGVRDQLHRYLQNARGKTTASGTILLAQELTRIQGLLDGETGWPVAIAKYAVTTTA